MKIKLFKLKGKILTPAKPLKVDFSHRIIELDIKELKRQLKKIGYKIIKHYEEENMKKKIRKLYYSIPKKFRNPSKKLLKFCVSAGWDAYWVGFCDGIKKVNQRNGD